MLPVIAVARVSRVRAALFHPSPSFRREITRAAAMSTSVETSPLATASGYTAVGRDPVPGPSRSPRFWVVASIAVVSVLALIIGLAVGLTQRPQSGSAPLCPLAAGSVLYRAVAAISNTSADGKVVAGTATFTQDSSDTVCVAVRVSANGVLSASAQHGFHVHAANLNDVALCGNGVDNPHFTTPVYGSVRVGGDERRRLP